MTITSPAGRRYESRSVEAGSHTVVWVPSDPGRARVRVAVEGLDGSTVADSAAFDVLSRPPTVRLTGGPTRAVVGRPVRFTFRVKDALSEVAEIATREGTSTRRYLIRNRIGVIRWTPTAPGPAVLRVRARGRQGQTAVDTARITVRPGPRAVAPTVTLLQVPDSATVGRGSEIAFQVAGSRVVVARIADDRGEARVWRFPRATGRVAFAWIPTRPGAYQLTVGARRRRQHDADRDRADRGARAMTATSLSPWQRHLFAAAACAFFGVLVQRASAFLPVQLATVGLGIGLVGASFLLAWAADAGEAVFHGGLVLAVIALVAVLPEFVIETRFATSGRPSWSRPT